MNKKKLSKQLESLQKETQELESYLTNKADQIKRDSYLQPEFDTTNDGEACNEAMYILNLVELLHQDTRCLYKAQAKMAVCFLLLNYIARPGKKLHPAAVMNRLDKMKTDTSANIKRIMNNPDIIPYIHLEFDKRKIYYLDVNSLNRLINKIHADANLLIDARGKQQYDLEAKYLRKYKQHQSKMKLFHKSVLSR